MVNQACRPRTQWLLARKTSSEPEAASLRAADDQPQEVPEEASQEARPPDAPPAQPAEAIDPNVQKLDKSAIAAVSPESEDSLPPERTL